MSPPIAMRSSNLASSQIRLWNRRPLPPHKPTRQPLNSISATNLRPKKSNSDKKSKSAKDESDRKLAHSSRDEDEDDGDDEDDVASRKRGKSRSNRDDGDASRDRRKERSSRVDEDDDRDTKAASKKIEPVAETSDSPFSFGDEIAPRPKSRSTHDGQSSAKTSRIPEKKPATRADEGEANFFGFENQNPPPDEAPKSSKKSSSKAWFHVRQVEAGNEALLYRVFVDGDQLVFITAAVDEDVSDMEEAAPGRRSRGIRASRFAIEFVI